MTQQVKAGLSDESIYLDYNPERAATRLAHKAIQHPRCNYKTTVALGELCGGQNYLPQMIGHMVGST
jgi:hypothetical protein